MLDTNIFNKIVDGLIELEAFAGRRLIATGIQRGELAKTSNPERRALLLRQFSKLIEEEAPAAGFAFNIEGAGFNQAAWNDGSGLVERMLARLKALDHASGKRPRGTNQDSDILIAETAIKSDAILISADRNLRKVTEEFGGRTLDPGSLEGPNLPE